MVKYVLKRLLFAVPMLIAISFFTCVMTRLIPGDPAKALLGERASPETIKKIREAYGLNDPIHVQYLKFLRNIFSGELGESIQSGEKIGEEIITYFPGTIELTFAAMIFGVTIGVLLGVLLAYKRNTWIDYMGTSFSFVGISIPIFWLGLILMYFLSVKYDLFPLQGRIGLDMPLEHITNFYFLDSLLTLNFEAFWDCLKHIILPAVALGTIPLSIITRITRASIVEELEKDYVKTARAKGVKERLVIYKHALKNGMIPILTITGLQTGYLLGGAIITETIFSWQGIGRWLFKAVQSRDYPVIQIGVMLVAATFIIVNLITDLLYPIFDPRVKLTR